MHPQTEYVLRKHIKPFAYSLISITGLLVGNGIRKDLTNVLDKEHSVRAILLIGGLSIPYTVALTLPISVFVAVLYVFTRFRAQEEDGPHRGTATVWQLVSPVLRAAAGLTLLSLLWNDQIVPRSNHTLRSVRALRLASRDPLSTSDREMTISQLRRAAAETRSETVIAPDDSSASTGELSISAAAQYEVEIHKKIAISFTSLAFVIVGAAIGLRMGRYLRRPIPTGIGVFVTSLAMFQFLHVGLIGGEALADRQVVSPILAMWTPNLILIAIGLPSLWQLNRTWRRANSNRTAA